MNSTENVKYVLTLNDLFSAQIKTAINESERLNKSVSNTQSTLSGLAGIAGSVFAGIGIAELGRGVMEVGQTFENAEMGLTTLLKSGEKAKEVFNAIKEDAMKTPFDFKTLLGANRALLSAGETAEGARKTVLALGNAISASGGGNVEFERMTANLMAIKNTGKATAMDIKQFGTAGVNIYQVLADATGKTIKETQNMEVSYDVLAMALEKAGQSGGLFENGLSNAMNTTTGKISNLGDQFDMFKNGLFLELKPVILSVIDSLGGLIETGAKMIPFVKEHSGAIKGIAFAVAGLTVAYNANNIISGIVALKTGLLTAGTITSTIATIAQIFATEGLTAGFMALNIAMSSNPIGLVIAGLALLTAGVIYCYNEFETFRWAMDTVWEVIKGVGMAIWDSLIMPFKIAVNGAMALWNVLTGDLSSAKANMQSMADAMLAPFNSVKEGILEANKVYKDSPLVQAKRLEKAEIKATAQKGKERDKGIIASLKDGVTPGATATTTGIETKDKASSVKSDKPININISIGKLIETQQIKVENAGKDFVNRIHDEVSKALLLAVNDANRIATQ